MKRLTELIEPRGNLVLLMELDRTKTRGGILLPDTVQNGQVAAVWLYKVVKCGPGAYNNIKGERIPISLEPGNIVAVNGAGAFAHPEWKAEKLCLCPETEIFAVLGFESDPEEAPLTSAHTNLRILS